MKPSHRALWPRTPTPQAAEPQAKLAKSADVLVVGAGVSGLTAAVLLARAGKRVVVVDMKPAVADGDTSKTTAHITQLFDSDYTTIVKNFGADSAKLYAAGLGRSIEAIEALVREFAIDCTFERVPAYLCAANRAEANDVKEEHRALSEAGVKSTWLEASPVSFFAGPALELPQQAQFDPIRYVQGLAKALVGLGGQVCCNVRYKSAKENADGVEVETDSGTIHVQHVVLATHTPPNKLTLQTKLVPTRTYAMAVRCQKELPPGLYYDTLDPYHYFRSYQSSSGPLVIVGGFDHRAGAVVQTDEAYGKLRAYADDCLGVKEVVSSWSGIVYEPTDGLPYIGLNPGTKRTYVITGLSGDGMTAGTLGAIVCADAICERANELLAVLAPSRIKPIAAASAFVAHNMQTAKHLVGDTVQAHLQTASPGPHEGLISARGLKSIAVYNDGQTIHEMSAVCPHAGCLVKFNQAEQCWDCPCHGSRFSGTGKLLSGPAVSDLPPHPS